MSKYLLTFEIKEDIDKLHDLLSGEISEDSSERFNIGMKKTDKNLMIEIKANDLASLRAMGNKVLNLLAITGKIDQILKE